MSYLVVPYTNETSEAMRYADGVMVGNYMVSGLVVDAIKIVSNADEKVRVNAYRSDNKIYLLVATTMTSVYVYSINYNSFSDIYQTINNSTSWTEGSSTWYYYSIDVTNYASNYTFLCTVYNSLSEAFSDLVESNNNNVITIIAQVNIDDSNDQGGASDEGGGDGDFDNTSDPVDIPAVPLIDATNAGLISIFRPSQEQLINLGHYLWTNITDFIENIQKMFSNPMDYLIALNIVPCTPDVGSSRTIKLGLWDTTISMPPVVSQWYEHDCGTIAITEYWGSALDYEPATRCRLFLPFIGSVEISTDEIMKKTLGVKYHIDLLSGQCVALVTINNVVYYQFTGECSVAVPLTGSDWSRVYSAAISAVGTAITGGISAAGAGVAAGTATTALAGSQMTNAVARAGEAFADVSEMAKGVKGVVQMRQSINQAAALGVQALENAAKSGTRVGNALRTTRLSGTINNTVGQIMGAKHSVAHSGSISGSAGILGVRVPYLLIEYPNQSLASNYKHFVGYPSNQNQTLGSISGYTEVEQVILSGINATDDELAMIEDALKGGVYL